MFQPAAAPVCADDNYTGEVPPVSLPGRLFDVGGMWEVVKRSDPVVSGLADRHYPRRARGCGRVGGPHRLIVLRSLDYDAGWISAYTLHPDDGLDAWRCTMFRREGGPLASEMIRSAMAITAELWGDSPPDGWLTYVDTAKVASRNPGYCFLRAGWWRDRSYNPDRRRASLIRLRAAA